MKLTLPTELRGFAFDRVLPVELNDFDVDILLPSVFFKILSGGRDRGHNQNKPEDVQKSIDSLRNHSGVQGFDGDSGKRTLDRLVRSTLIQTGRQGTKRNSEQIQGFTGYTLLTAKPGFPKESSTLRKVDQLIYRMMRGQFESEDELWRFFKGIFGRGLELNGPRDLKVGGSYDGVTKLDTMTLLAIDYLDGFIATEVKQRNRNERSAREACPPIAGAMARDLRRYLQAYHKRMPVEALTYHLKALINFELLIYTLKLFDAVTTLVGSHDQLPPAMDERAERAAGPTKPQLYLDFTGEAAGPSRQMAVASVRNCLDLAQRFVRANLTVRQLDRYVRALRSSRRVRVKIESVLADDEGGPRYLLSLVRLLDDAEVAREIDASARQDIDAVRRDTLPPPSPGKDEEDTGEFDSLIDSIVQPAESDFEAIVLLLVETQGQKIHARVVKWLYSVGGLAKPYGVLTGILKGRGKHNWRFAPTNDLLSTLVQLAAVNTSRWDKDNPAPQPIPLADFLEFLEDRFGILVDRPLDGFVGAEYAAAARENVRAMLRRLGQMGVFRDLSDDFTVQRLLPPYTSDHEEVPA